MTKCINAPAPMAAAMTLALAVLPLDRSSAAERPVPAKAIIVDVCTVMFAEEIDVPALDAGPLVSIQCSENQAVSADEVLARLDDATLLIRRRAAELRRAQLAARAADEIEAQYAETVYDEAAIEHELNLRQSQKSPGTITQDSIRRSKLALQRAGLERERVKKQLRDAEVDLALQQAEIDVLEDHQRRLQVKSPTDGVVLTMHKARGEWVNEGEPIARVGRMDHLKITARLSESELSPRRAVGASVVVRWREGESDHTLRGRIESVDPQMFDDGFYRVHVMIENRKTTGGWLLTPGRTVVMTVHPSEMTDDAPASARRLQGDVQR